MGFVRKLFGAKPRVAPEEDEPGQSEPEPIYSGWPLSYWLRALQSADPETRWDALDALRPIGPEAKAAIPSLVKLMGSDDQSVGIGVSCLLGKIGFHLEVAEKLRSDPEAIANLLLETPTGSGIRLGQLAEFVKTTGPVVLYREKMMRRIVVSCNVQGRDRTAVPTEIRQGLRSAEKTCSPPITSSTRVVCRPQVPKFVSALL